MKAYYFLIVLIFIGRQEYIHSGAQTGTFTKINLVGKPINGIITGSTIPTPDTSFIASTFTINKVNVARDSALKVFAADSMAKVASKVGYGLVRRHDTTFIDTTQTMTLPLAARQGAAIIAMIPTDNNQLSNGMSYLTKSVADGYYYPISGNPSSFLTSVPAQSWTSITGKPTFATVATSGSYTDLINTPSIPSAQVNTDWNSASGISQLLNKPVLANVATSGSYSDLNNTPTIPTNTNQLINGSGYITSVPAQSFSSLTGKPTTLYGYGITDAYPLSSNPAGYLTSIGWSSITGKPTFATVATTGSYLDLSNSPSIPAAQVNSDWNSVSGASQVLNKPSLATVATSGSYNDLTSKPTIPTNTNQLTNGSGFITSVPAQSFASLTGKPTSLSGYGITDAYPLSGNPSGFISTVPAQAFSSLTGVPTTISGYGITDAVANSGSYTNPTWIVSIPFSKITGFTSASVIGALGYTPSNPSGTTLQYTRGDGTLATLNTSVVPESSNLYYTDARGRTAISVTTTGSGAATYSSSTGILNIPTATSYVAPTIHNNVSRTLNSAFTLTGPSGGICFYSYSIQIQVTLLGAGTVTPQYSTDGGTTWIICPAIVSPNLLATTVQQVSGSCPANAMFKIVTSSTGTVTFTYNSGQETY